MISTATLILSTTGLIGAEISVLPLEKELNLDKTFFGSFAFYYHDDDMNMIKDITIDSDVYLTEIFIPNFAKFAKRHYVFYQEYPKNETEGIDFKDVEVHKRLMLTPRFVIEEIVILLQEAMEYNLIPMNDDVMSIDTSGSRTQNLM